MHSSAAPHRRRTRAGSFGHLDPASAELGRFLKRLQQQQEQVLELIREKEAEFRAAVEAGTVKAVAPAPRAAAVPAAVVPPALPKSRLGPGAAAPPRGAARTWDSGSRLCELRTGSPGAWCSGGWSGQLFVRRSWELQAWPCQAVRAGGGPVGGAGMAQPSSWDWWSCRVCKAASSLLSTGL